MKREGERLWPTCNTLAAPCVPEFCNQSGLCLFHLKAGARWHFWLGLAPPSFVQPETTFLLPLQKITCILRESDGTRSRVPQGQSPSSSSAYSLSLRPIGPLTAASATQTCIYPWRDMRSGGGGGGEKTTTNARGRGCLGRKVKKYRVDR